MSALVVCKGRCKMRALVAGTGGKRRRRRRKVGRILLLCLIIYDFLSQCRYILQNHALFLTEQPLADMATLLLLFKPTVLPVVKKRAKELLSVITEAVKRSLCSSRPEGSGSGSKTEKEVNGSEKRDDVVMLDTEVQILERESQKPDLTSIWRGLLLIHILSMGKMNNSCVVTTRFFCHFFEFLIWW
jgi:hypothetical protein